MPREFQHLVMTKIRRIACPPREAECIARVLLMQVILVCVVHAAQKTWYAGRAACDKRPEELVPGGSLTLSAAGTPACELDPADSPGIPLRVLWECVTGSGELQPLLKSRNFSHAGHRHEPLARLIHRPVSG
jgi:hypothetical protein